MSVMALMLALMKQMIPRQRQRTCNNLQRCYCPQCLRQVIFTCLLPLAAPHLLSQGTPVVARGQVAQPGAASQI